MYRIAVCLAIAFLPSACRTARTAGDNDRPRMQSELGKRLFFDNRLSAGKKMSCATCHQPEKAFTNGEATARGVHGELGERNVPTLINRAGSTIQFWDGRAPSLEDQVTIVITSNHEMGADIKQVLEDLRIEESYRSQFKKAFGEEGIDPAKIARAIAAFERTITAGESAYDRYQAGDLKALTQAQVRGMNLFFHDFKCVSCHNGPNFSDEAMRPRCYPATNNLNQFQPIQIEKSKWVKTPTLRNLNYTAPYMHNGSLDTIAQVVDFYTPSFQVGPDRLPKTRLPVVKINRRQRDDIVQFLMALSADEPYLEVFEATKF